MRSFLAVLIAIGLLQSCLALRTHAQGEPGYLLSRRDRWFGSTRQTKLMTSFVPGAKKLRSAAAGSEC